MEDRFSTVEGVVDPGRAARSPLKILVTGNLGYVGAVLTRSLRASRPDAVLVGLDMGFFGHCLTAARRLPETQLDMQYFADVRSLPAGLLHGVDVVVHLAAISNDPMGHRYEDVTYDINVTASIALAREARRAGVRSFVFASSCSVYGCANDRPRDEYSAVEPLTAYARSKVLTENALRRLAGPEFLVTCLRFATACGMSDRLRLDLVLNEFVASALATKQITVLSDGTPWRPLIDVKDMARAIGWAIGRGAAQGGDCLVVNAGSDAWNYQVRDLAAAVAAAVPGTEVAINQHAPPDRRSYQVDFALFRALAPHDQPQSDLVRTIGELRDGIAAMRGEAATTPAPSAIRLQVLADLERDRLLRRSLEWVDKPRSEAAFVVGGAPAVEVG